VVGAIEGREIGLGRRGIQQVTGRALQQRAGALAHRRIVGPARPARRGPGARQEQLGAPAHVRRDPALELRVDHGGEGALQRADAPRAEALRRSGRLPRELGEALEQAPGAPAHHLARPGEPRAVAIAGAEDGRERHAAEDQGDEAEPEIDQPVG